MKKLILLALLITSIYPAFAQRPRVKEGNIETLKGIKKINLKYDYSGMEVGKKAEKEYIAEKKEALNKKESGRGDKWEKDWYSDRNRRFEPRFEEEFNKYDPSIAFATPPLLNPPITIYMHHNGLGNVEMELLNLVSKVN